MQKRVEATIGWLPHPSIHGYIALILPLVVSLVGSFDVRRTSVKNLHYVAQPKDLLIYLNEPAGVSQSGIESKYLLADFT